MVSPVRIRPWPLRNARREADSAASLHFVCQPAQEYGHDRAEDFVKLLKKVLPDIHFSGPECEEKLIASRNPFFPCEGIEGELEYKDSEPKAMVPPIDPMGPSPSPGTFLPVPTWTPTPAPQPVYPIIP